MTIIFKINYIILLLLIINLIIALWFNNRGSVDGLSTQKDCYRVFEIREVKEIKDFKTPISYPVYDPKDKIEVNSY